LVYHAEIRHHIAMGSANDNKDRTGFWIRRAGRLAFIINMGWWWKWFASFLLIGSLLFAGANYVARYLAYSAGQSIWILFFSFLVLASIISYFKARTRFIDKTAALARMDLSYRYHNRLVSAYAGIGDWPPVPGSSRHAGLPVRWRWSSVLSPAVLAMATLALSLWLPVGTLEAESSVIRHEPPAWSEVESMVDSLDEQDVVEDDALQELLDQVAEMRRKPSEEWYRQGVMEATDHLRNEVERDARKLQQSLDRAVALLEVVEARKDQLSQPQVSAIQDLLKELMDQLGQGSLPLNEELMNQLKNVSVDQIRKMSAQELADLERKLREKSEFVALCMSMTGVGDTPGRGGVSRGPGTLPLTLEETESHVDQATPEALSNPNLERAALGQTIGLADGQHNVDTEAYKGLVEAGRTASPGGEGEVVWRQEVLPAEQRILKQFFK